MSEPCPYCHGKKPTRREPGVIWIMCIRCWRLVPLALRREQAAAFKAWKSAGKPRGGPYEHEMQDLARECLKAAKGERAALGKRTSPLPFHQSDVGNSR